MSCLLEVSHDSGFLTLIIYIKYIKSDRYQIILLTCHKWIYHTTSSASHISTAEAFRDRSVGDQCGDYCL